MSQVVECAAQPMPELTFHLPGVWAELDPGDPQANAPRIKRFAEAVVGRGDVRARARAALRTRLTEAVATSRDATAQRVFLCEEIRPGVPLPTLMTLFAPGALRMSPAIGTDPLTVAGVFESGLRESDAEDLSTLARLSIPGAQIRRLHRFMPLVGGEESPALARVLVAEYWYTMPGSKELALVAFSTPLGDISGLMLGFFDAIVLASRIALVGEHA